MRADVWYNCGGGRYIRNCDSPDILGDSYKRKALLMRNRAKVLLIAILLTMCAGCVNKAYPSREACLTAEMAWKEFLLEVPGEDSSLLCYYDASDPAFVYKMMALRKGVWQICQQWDFKYAFLDGYVCIKSIGLSDSEDRYVIVSAGPSFDGSVASLTWSLSDLLGSEFYKVVQADGKSARFYARIPADTDQCSLQINDAWCIEDIDFQCEWNDTLARRDPVDD